MIFVDNEQCTDPHVNLAIEEYLLGNLQTEGEVLLFYINEPSIIIGRNQNTIEEINLPYVEANGIHVVRRLSGGGAVYHDLGNLNFSFITHNARENILNFRKFTAPVIDLLNNLGAPAVLSGRNDILIGEQKISGNAQYIRGQRMVSHGTLLFNSDLTCVSEALQVKQSKISSKGIKSVRSRVTNISEHLSEAIDILDFRHRLLDKIFQENSIQINPYHLTESDWTAIHELANSRYRSWDWNYGSSPEFNLRRSHRFQIGEIDVRINVKHGMIRSVKIFGDFFGQGEIADFEQRLINIRYSRDSLAEALKGIDLSYYFGVLSIEEFLVFLY